MTARDYVIIDMAALTSTDLRITADMLITASNHPKVSSRGGAALAVLADQIITAARARPTKARPPRA